MPPDWACKGIRCWPRLYALRGGVTTSGPNSNRQNPSWRNRSPLGEHWPSLAVVSALALGRLWMATGRTEDARELTKRARRMIPRDVASALFELVDACEVRIGLQGDG